MMDLEQLRVIAADGDIKGSVVIDLIARCESAENDRDKALEEIQTQVTKYDLLRESEINAVSKLYYAENELKELREQKDSERRMFNAAIMDLAKTVEILGGNENDLAPGLARVIFNNLQKALGCLADIGNCTDMNISTIKQKALRIYKEIQPDFEAVEDETPVAQSRDSAEPVVMQWCEIGESGWKTTKDKIWYGYCQSSPKHDTRTIPPQSKATAHSEPSLEKMGMNQAFTEYFKTCRIELPGINAAYLKQAFEAGQQSPAVAVPDGFKLVPIEPTEKMLDAGVAMALQVSVHDSGGWSKYIAALYAQLLSAAPQPSVEQSPDYKAQRDKMLAVLVRVDEFLTNGIALGYIRLPDADCPDTAHQVPGLVRTAIAEGGE